LRTVIFGEPNAGKSSLLNRLLGYERAIVSHLPGTTRDTLEEVINLRGIPVRLIDTAGMRPSRDLLENAGMERTRQVLSRAALALQIADASQPPPMTEAHFPSVAARTLLVLNKCDLGADPGWDDGPDAIRISCKTGEGFDVLSQAIFDAAMRGAGTPDDYMIAINARHQGCLKSAGDYLDAARRAMEERVSPEFIAVELRAAMTAVGEVAGRLDAEELLGEIFSRFCIGK
jgi:tRNA modification GTPase